MFCLHSEKFWQFFRKRKMKTILSQHFLKAHNCFKQAPRFHIKVIGISLQVFGKHVPQAWHWFINAYVFSLLPNRDRPKVPKAFSSRFSNSYFSTNRNNFREGSNDTLLLQKSCYAKNDSWLSSSWNIDGPKNWEVMLVLTSPEIKFLISP